MMRAESRIEFVSQRIVDWKRRITLAERELSGYLPDQVQVVVPRTIESSRVSDGRIVSEILSLPRGQH